MTKMRQSIYYVLLVIVSAIFLLASFSKLSGNSMAEAGFTKIGLPIWFMYVIGIGELCGVVGLWIRPLFRYAYEGLFVVLAGAIVTTVAFVSVPARFFRWSRPSFSPSSCGCMARERAWPSDG
jgi:uncharacterized membrane protein YphA (DoxX/SURF4 family)